LVKLRGQKKEQKIIKKQCLIQKSGRHIEGGLKSPRQPTLEKRRKEVEGKKRREGAIQDDLLLMHGEKYGKFKKRRSKREIHPIWGRSGGGRGEVSLTVSQ